MFEITVPRPQYRGMSLEQIDVLGELRKSFEKKRSVVEVLRVRYLPTGEELCMKKMQLVCDEDSRLLANELRVLYQLEHPHIVKLCGHFVEGDHIYALYQLVEKSVKKQNKTLTEEESVTIVWQLCSALKYLHGREMLHRDVNLDNLLMNRGEHSEIDVKLIDFECAAVFSPMRKTQHGTLASLAPEVVMEAYQTEKIDCWGVGVVLYNLLTKGQPFQVKGQNIYERTSQRIKKLDYEMPEDLNEQAKNLLSSIFVLDPKQRLSIEQIMAHPFVRKYIKVEEPEMPEPPGLAAFQSKLAKMEHQSSEFVADAPSEVFPEEASQVVVNEPSATTPQHRQLEQKIKKLEAALAAKRAAQSSTKPKDLVELEKKAQQLEEQFNRVQHENDELKQKLKESELTCMKFEKEKRSMDEHRINLEKSKLQLGKINSNVQRVLEQNNRITSRIGELERQLERLKRQEGGTDSDLFATVSSDRQRLVHLKPSPSSGDIGCKFALTVGGRTEEKSQRKEPPEASKSARRLN